MSGKSQRNPPVVELPTQEDAYRTNYTDTFGGKIGGGIWDQIESNANPEKLDGYLGSLVDSGTSGIGDFITGNASDEDQDLALQASQLIQSQLGGDIKDWIGGTGLSEGVYDWLGEHPIGTGLAGLGAAGLFIASDPALKGEFDFDLSKNTELTLGGDAGSLFDVGLHEAHGRLTHTDGNQQYGFGAAYDFDQDQSSVNAFYRSNNGMGTSFAANADVTHQSDRNTASADLSYLTPTWGAKAGANYDSSHPDFGEYSQFQASAFSRGDGPSQWNVGGQFDTEGAYRLNGGYDWSNETSSFGLKGFTGSDGQGNSDTGIMAQFTHKF